VTITCTSSDFLSYTYVNILTYFVTMLLYACGIQAEVFENRVLTRMFGPKRDEVTGECREPHNEELMICIPHPILCG
jgi:hypothetical protein